MNTTQQIKRRKKVKAHFLFTREEYMHKISVSLRVVVMIVATALVVAGCMNPMQGS